MLDLRRAQQHMLQSLEAIDYSDQKVLNQFVAVSGFLGLTDLRTGPVVKFGACAIARREWALGLEALANAVAFDLQHGGAYTGDRENCLFVATQYDRAAQSIGWSSGQSIQWDNKQIHVGVIVSNLADDESATVQPHQEWAGTTAMKRPIDTHWDVTAVGVHEGVVDMRHRPPARRRGRERAEVAACLTDGAFMCWRPAHRTKACEEEPCRRVELGLCRQTRRDSQIRRLFGLAQDRPSIRWPRRRRDIVRRLPVA